MPNNIEQKEKQTSENKQDIVINDTEPLLIEGGVQPKITIYNNKKDCILKKINDFSNCIITNLRLGVLNVIENSSDKRKRKIEELKKNSMELKEKRKNRIVENSNKKKKNKKK